MRFFFFLTISELIGFHYPRITEQHKRVHAPQSLTHTCRLRLTRDSKSQQHERKEQELKGKFKRYPLSPAKISEQQVINQSAGNQPTITFQPTQCFNLTMQHVALSQNIRSPDQPPFTCSCPCHSCPRCASCPATLELGGSSRPPVAAFQLLLSASPDRPQLVALPSILEMHRHSKLAPQAT